MRFEKNLAVIKSLKSVVDLKEYTGFGGLHKSLTKEEHKALESVLGISLYSEVMASCKTAYYTPVEIIKAIYKGVENLGFTGGRILEPSCGSGAFIFNCPDSIKNNSRFFAVELDKISANLTRIICPYTQVLNARFEEAKYHNNSFDLIAGNPPYSNQVIYNADKELNDLVVHHFFVAKSIKLLKDNGILAFVLPTYCLDNVKNQAQRIFPWDMHFSKLQRT